MAMTKADYELIAAALKRIKPASPDAWAQAVHALAKQFEQTNPRFDYFRFVQACGAGIREPS